jgi:hypothetical protein
VQPDFHLAFRSQLALHGLPRFALGQRDDRHSHPRCKLGLDIRDIPLASCASWFAVFLRGHWLVLSVRHDCRASLHSKMAK